jgi:hypothetical protein
VPPVVVAIIIIIIIIMIMMVVARRTQVDVPDVRDIAIRRTVIMTL